MTSNTKRKEESHLLNGGVKQPTWSKAFNSNAIWEEKVSQPPLLKFSTALLSLPLPAALNPSAPNLLPGV